ncbi:CCA tRNA nucleotidyltransferase [Coleofasciculus sp. FACHB-1120]|uniref:CCA tRNA nucleotidyltransferase n=1 Tax=Coleofasciculus sp. FACHB-1120 TaxID=2692783 RepID=UPI001684291E|nr:CCA tRNA nucleotidyltransferase [Coleofasciculus sp. FACHB-1120]MBD2741995.1 CCA tRNA nucleotidyltransferase [Coleofasciculus sp. FACHB-1120]
MHLNTDTSTLSPETWPFSLELLPEPAYMVGGAVRDALLGRRREYRDLDFVLLGDAVKTARKIASRYKVGFVLLDAQRQIARVVFEQATVDIAQAEGSNLEIDLQRRDYTMNAIAYNPHTGELIDPLNGYADLQQGIIRMVSPKNLQDDPLRLLRAYRQAAQLNFTIESDTQSAIRQLAPLLGQVSAERVQAEFAYLLNTSEGTPWIIAAVEDGLLQTWFPSASSPQPLPKPPLQPEGTIANLQPLPKPPLQPEGRIERLMNPPLSPLPVNGEGVWGRGSKNLSTILPAVERSAVVLGETWHELASFLSSLVGDTLKTSWLGIAKLATLLSPVAEAAEAELLNLKYSRAEIRAITTALKLLPQLQSSQMSLGAQYLFFREAGQVFPVILVLALADGVSVAELTPLINRYLTPDDPVAHPAPFVTGKDLIQTFNLPSGPQVGQFLTAIGIARAEGKISTPAEAIKLVSQLLNEG